MFEALETGIGLDIVLALQSIESDLLALLAEILHLMGSEIFYVIVLLVIYWSINRHLGVRMVFVALFAGVLNGLLKELFQRPRPDIVSDLVVRMVDQTGPGIPSGHVMLNLALWGYAAVHLQRRWIYWALAFFMVLMGWGRMYAGVHYPHDVLAGLLFGLVALWLYLRLAEGFGQRWTQLRPGVRAAIVVILGLIAAVTVVIDPTGTGPAIAGVLVGVGPGRELELRHVRFSSDGSVMQRILRVVLGIALMLAIYLGLRMLFAELVVEGTPVYALLRGVRYAAVTFFAAFVWPLLMVRTGLAGQIEPEPQP